MKEYDKLTSENKAGEKVAHKIAIMEEVLEHFKTRLAEESVTYSHRLEENIQSLINEMLTSKRSVSVSKEFAVRVTDSFGDESKSEGQFAVVSFAYIGGILKMLRSEEHLSAKEYPLVLDGPFSKLDPDQRQNVIDMIPKFAPQVILFSKDDLHGIFKEENIGRVYTIVSNDEKNIAKVEEGHLWK
jgi:DNA repair exonuclease SbcCD ATPase subunit